MLHWRVESAKQYCSLMSAIRAALFVYRDLGITSLFGLSCMYFPQNHVFASGAAANLLGFV